MIARPPDSGQWQLLLRKTVALALERAASDLLSRVPILVGEKLILPPREWRVCGKVHVVGWGKAALPVVERVWASVPRDRRGAALCVQERSGWSGGVELLRGEHPIPGPGSFAAGRRMMELFRSADANDTMIAVSSGGGSAMLALPVEGVGAEDKTEMNRVLLRLGLCGQELGLIRSRVSAIKGGGLATVFRGALLVTLVVSDHVEALGDATEAARFVASGPTGAHATAELDDLATRIDLSSLPVAVRKCLTEHQPTSTAPQGRATARQEVVLADVRSLTNALSTSLQILGVDIVRVREAPFRASTERLATELVDECLAFESGRAGVLAYVAGGEMSLHYTGGGQGGRCQHLAAQMVQKLSPEGCFAAVAFGSDGVDNTPGVAGALATLGLQKHYREAPERFMALLNAYDSHRLHEELGTLVRTPATCCHLGEAVVILRNVGRV